jgi:uncharacterized protein YqgC (DUF456 family)
MANLKEPVNMNDILLISLLILACLIGVAMTAIRFPGTWLIVASAVGYAWGEEWPRASLTLLGILTGIALLGEGIEILASVVTARRAGASRKAAWGGMFGGILGMIFLSFLVPIPIVGTMIGALVGCFVGATLVEMYVRKDMLRGTKVGVFAAMGFVLGTVAKVFVALVMSGILLSAVIGTEPFP